MGGDHHGENRNEHIIEKYQWHGKNVCRALRRARNWQGASPSHGHDLTSADDSPHHQARRARFSVAQHQRIIKQAATSCLLCDAGGRGGAAALKRLASSQASTALSANMASKAWFGKLKRRAVQRNEKCENKTGGIKRKTETSMSVRLMAGVAWAAAGWRRRGNQTMNQATVARTSASGGRASGGIVVMEYRTAAQRITHQHQRGGDMAAHIAIRRKYHRTALRAGTRLSAHQRRAAGKSARFRKTRRRRIIKPRRCAFGRRGENRR